MRNALLYRHVGAQRTRTGGTLISRRKAAPGILRALRKGAAVGVLNDQYSRRTRGVFVPFFGVRCSTSAGIATLALRTGSPVLPAYTLRDGPDHHLLTILPPLETPQTGDRKRDIEVATAHYNEALEAIIRKHPEQWMWGHRRFRHSPDLPGNPY